MLLKEYLKGSFSTEKFLLDTFKDFIKDEEAEFSKGVSVDAIEQAINYDLLSKVPEAIQNVVEAKVDLGPTR